MRLKDIPFSSFFGCLRGPYGTPTPKLLQNMVLFHILAKSCVLSIRSETISFFSLILARSHNHWFWPILAPRRPPMGPPTPVWTQPIPAVAHFASQSLICPSNKNFQYLFYFFTVRSHFGHFWPFWAPSGAWTLSWGPPSAPMRL